jgi:ABC-type amino acid transport substrate-binding protein
VLGTVTLLTLAGASGCDLPRDPNDTLARVQSSGLRAGAVANPPWVEHGRVAAGPEVALIERFARELGTDVRWRLGSEQELFAALETFELDLVVGGLQESNPHFAHVATSRPFGETLAGHPIVIATAPGENRFLLTLDAFLHRRAAAVLGASLPRAMQRPADGGAP